ncbi:MAG: patatin-like phospholipase family protein [Phycisphaerales bacterium]|nr:patatin-like phospholipase family protein [Phycisphaerales bacterium]
MNPQARIARTIFFISMIGALVGCCSSRKCPGVVQSGPTQSSTQWIGGDDFVSDAVEESIRKKLTIKNSKTNYNSLVLSSGGQFGAYSAGFLANWPSKQGRLPRPDFDIITGVSAGATVAPFAYLGDEVESSTGRTYLSRIAEIYRSIDSDDIFQLQPVRGLLFGNSLASTKRYRNLAMELVTKEMVQKIAEKYDKTGSLLLVGAANLDQGVMKYFDLTKIATTNPAELSMDQKVIEIRRAVLASSAVPVFFEPVEISGMMYVDGAAVQGVFLPKTTGKIDKVCNRFNLDSRVFVILNDFESVEPVCVDDCVPSIGARSLELLLAQNMCMSIKEIETRIESKPGNEFYFSSASRVDLPLEYKSGVGGTFNNGFMNWLADQGRDRALSGQGWAVDAPDCLAP